MLSGSNNQTCRGSSTASLIKSRSKIKEIATIQTIILGVATFKRFKVLKQTQKKSANKAVTQIWTAQCVIMEVFQDGEEMKNLQNIAGCSN